MSQKKMKKRNLSSKLFFTVVLGVSATVVVNALFFQKKIPEGVLKSDGVRLLSGVIVNQALPPTFSRERKNAQLAPDDQLLAIIEREVVRTKTTFNADLSDRMTVAAIQRALNIAGYGPIIEDGFWGRQTKDAIEKFRKDKGLKRSASSVSVRLLQELTSLTGIPIV